MLGHKGGSATLKRARPGALPPDDSEPARRWPVEDRASLPMDRSSNSGEIAQQGLFNYLFTPINNGR